MNEHIKRDRRSGVDRRQKDLGPPRGIERRKGIEPRKPEVTEIEITPSEWGRLQEALEPLVPTPPTPDKAA